MIKLLDYLFLFLGIKVRRIGSGLLRDKKRYQWIQDMNIKTIIDVGAHEGEFALEMSQIFPEARIYSFEPLAEPFKKLNQKLKNVARFQSFNLALGDYEGHQQM